MWRVKGGSHECWLFSIHNFHGWSKNVVAVLRRFRGWSISRGKSNAVGRKAQLHRNGGMETLVLWDLPRAVHGCTPVTTKL